MFVESMTFEEIRQEFEREKRSLTGKIVHYSGKILKRMRKTNMSFYEEFLEYISIQKNRWVLHFQGDHKLNKNFRIYQYCWFYRQRSYSVMSYAVETDQLMYFSGHFFTRFYQREKLESENMHDLVRTFFKTNSLTVTQALKEVEPGSNIWQVFVQTNTGVGLGYWHRKVNVVEMRTFITNDMLKGSQVELSKQLEEKFKLNLVRKSPGEEFQPPKTSA